MVTVTEKEHVAISPSVSVKVYTTSVMPTMKDDSGVCVDVVVNELTSVASGGVHVAVVPSGSVVDKAISCGHPVITGGELSTVMHRKKTSSTV